MADNSKAKFELPREFLLPAVVLAAIAAYATPLRALLPNSGQLAVAIGVFIFAVAGTVHVFRATAKPSVFENDNTPKPRFGRKAKALSVVVAFLSTIPVGVCSYWPSAPAEARSTRVSVQVNSPNDNRGSVTYQNSPGVVNGNIFYNSDKSDIEEKQAIENLIRDGHSEDVRESLVTKAKTLRLSIDSNEEPLAKKKAEYVETCNYISQLFYFNGRLTDSEWWLKKALEISPDNPTALNDLGGLYVEHNKRADAKKLYEQIIQTPDADDVEKDIADSNLGVVAMEDGEYDQAEKRFKHYLGISLKRNDMPAICGCYLNLGKVEMLKGQRAQAKDYFSKALNIAHISLSNPGTMATCLTNLGVICKDEGDLDGAEKQLRLAIDIAETDSRLREKALAQLNLAEVLLQSGELEDAKTNANDALARYKTNGVPDGQSILGGILERIDKAQKHNHPSSK